MTLSARMSLVVAACITLHACSSAPATPNATSANTYSPQAQSAGSSTAPTGTAPNRIVLEDKTLTTDEVRELLAQGYKPVGRNGQVYYCRREQLTGSNVRSTICKSADEMKQLATSSEKSLSTMQDQSGVMRH